MKSIYIEDIELIINSGNEEKLFIKNKSIKLPDIVIPRLNTSYHMKSVMDFIESE